MAFFNFLEIVEHAWRDYDPSRSIKSVSDISARVSTNHVYKITFTNGSFVIAKISYFGKYEHFLEDHTIINVLANNLPAPFENFLARSLIKGNQLYTYRYQDGLLDAWVVFYNPIKIDQKLPSRLNEDQIKILGRQFAVFHQTCTNISNTLPASSKTLFTDIHHLLDILETDIGQFEHRGYVDQIRRQCQLFMENYHRFGAGEFPKIPVFIDWNIGNFSVTKHYRLFSRWDYDWFRMSTRMLDFYFLGRIVSDIGDRTVFSYLIDPLMEDRFLLFLQNYHQVFPLTEAEVRFLSEVYRFFILKYVIMDGRYFFHELYATRLQKEAYDIYFPALEQRFSVDHILKALKL